MENSVKCLVVRGPAGVGKSTIARKMVLQNNFVLINCDTLRANTFGEDKWEKEYKIKTTNLAIEKVKYLIEQGKRCIIDDVFEYSEQFDLLNNLLLDIQWVTLICSLDTCAKRDSTRQYGTTEHGYCGQQAIEYLYKSFNNQRLDNEIVIDTENKTIEEVYYELSSKLNI